MNADEGEPGSAADGVRMRRCGVLGSPIGHSLSPVLHRAAYAALGLPWEYDAYEVTADGLAAFVSGLDADWRGLSLTMPLKQVAGALCAYVEPLAARLQAVNTMIRADDGTWSGHNTDVGGLRDALTGSGSTTVTTVRSAVLVGAGATAGSALAAVTELGAERVTVLARSPERAAVMVALGRDLGVHVAVASLAEVGSLDAGADVLISTIPASAQADLAADLARQADVVMDVVYEPRVTPLLSAAAVRGAVVVPGLELLLYQAARQVVLMTGVPEAPIEAMRAALG